MHFLVCQRECVLGVVLQLSLSANLKVHLPVRLIVEEAGGWYNMRIRSELRHFQWIEISKSGCFVGDKAVLEVIIGARVQIWSNVRRYALLKGATLPRMDFMKRRRLPSKPAIRKKVNF